MKYWLRHLTEFGWLVGAFLSLCCLLLWVPDFMGAEASVWNTVFTMVLAIVNAVFLMYLFFQIGVTSTRRSMPLFCYLLFIGSISVLHTCWSSQLTLLGIQVVLLLLAGCYRSENAVQESFIGTVIILACSMMQPDMLFLLPVFWIGLAVQRAFNLRVLLASVIACVVFALYVWLSQKFFGGWFEGFRVVTVKECFARTWWGTNPLWQILYTEVTGVVFAVLSALALSRESSRAGSMVIQLLMILLVSGVLLLFPPVMFSSLLSVAVYAASALTAYYFCTHTTMASGIIFIVCLLLSAALSVCGMFLSM